MSTTPPQRLTTSRALTGLVIAIAVLAVVGVVLAAFGAQLPIASALVTSDDSGSHGQPNCRPPTTATTSRRHPVRERGNAIECTGPINGLDAYVQLYENSHYGNSVQIVLDDDGLGAGRDHTQPFVHGEQVHGAVLIAGTRAVVTGTVTRGATKLPVHEEFDHAGEHVVTDGFQQKLTTDLTLTYGTPRLR